MIDFLDELKAYFQRAAQLKGVSVDHSRDLDELVNTVQKFPFVNIIGGPVSYEDIRGFNWDEGDRKTHSLTIHYAVRTETMQAGVRESWLLSDNIWLVIKNYISSKHPIVRIDKKPVIVQHKWKMKDSKWVIGNDMTIELLKDVWKQ